ncbi:MAG: hypothetical protein HZC28_17390 [Spirochaetes bacterium]|nr:hypothetical protein [Spirochaetota bacterium]
MKRIILLGTLFALASTLCASLFMYQDKKKETWRTNPTDTKGMSPDKVLTTGTNGVPAFDFTAALSTHDTADLTITITGVSADIVKDVAIWTASSFDASFWRTYADVVNHQNTNDGSLSIKVKLRLKNGIESTVVTKAYTFIVPWGAYASASGNDANDGLTRTTAVKNIPTAIAKALAVGRTNIYIATGTYTRANGINNTTPGIDVPRGFRFRGGWDSGFNTQSGYSTLYGENSIATIMRITNAWDVYIERFMLSGATNRPIDAQYITNCVITNCILTANTNTGASSYGGGMFVQHMYNCIINMSAISNSANNGGGIYVEYGAHNKITGMYINNYGCGIRLYGMHSNYVDAIVGGNIAADCAGISIYGSLSNIIYGDVYSNVSTNAGGGGGAGGGGIKMNGTFPSSDRNVINASVRYNVVTNGDGGGIYIANSISGNTINGAISQNKAVRSSGLSAGNGGGIGMYQANSNVINGAVTFNESISGSSGGGGVSLSSYCAGNRFYGDIAYNNANTNGGGVVMTGNYNLFSNIIVGNILLLGPISKGGGLYATNGCSNTIVSIFSNNQAREGAAIYLVSTYGNSICGTIANHSVSGGIATVFFRLAPTNGITGTIINNTMTTGAGAVTFEASTNCYLTNAYVTNNVGFSPFGVISLVNAATACVIQSCVIGGTNGLYGIAESGTDTTGHTIMNNIFITNRLGNLYTNTIGGTTPCVVTNSAAGWSQINTEAYSGATTANGNTVTNW